jgi:putative ABC transport system permease protein
VLLAAAGLFIRSFAQLAHADPGFNPNHALLMRVGLTSPRYAQSSDRTAFADALVSRLRAIPGVQAAAVSNALPLREDLVARAFFKDRPDATPEQTPPLHDYGVSSDYFRAMGIRLIRGRTFTDYDDAKAPRVAVINESFARRHFPNEDPIGKRIHTSGSGAAPLQPDWKEIVGVVADTTHYGVDQMTPNQAYNPYPQGNIRFWPLNVVIRTASSMTALHSMAKAQVYAVDPNQPIKEILALDDLLSGSRSRQRFTMRLLTAFSAVALFLAAIGIYGVIAFSVSRRTTEIGIRMALGAQSLDVLRLVMLQCCRQIGVGVLLGLGGTLAAGPLIESMLFKTSPRDPFTLAAITLVLTGVAALASWLPARRATKVDPIVALRAE